jgi:hypothetical protein
MRVSYLERYIKRLGSGQEVADRFCKVSSSERMLMKAFATQALLSIKFMEHYQPDPFVGEQSTVKYMKNGKTWDDFALRQGIKEFERYAKKYLRNGDRRMGFISARSKRELMANNRSQKTSHSS